MQPRTVVGARDPRQARLRARGAWEQDAGGGADPLAGVQARELLRAVGAKQQDCCGRAEAPRVRAGERTRAGSRRSSSSYALELAGAGGRDEDQPALVTRMEAPPCSSSCE